MVSIVITSNSELIKVEGLMVSNSSFDDKSMSWMSSSSLIRRESEDDDLVMKHSNSVEIAVSLYEDLRIVWVRGVRLFGVLIAVGDLREWELNKKLVDGLFMINDDNNGIGTDTLCIVFDQDSMV